MTSTREIIQTHNAPQAIGTYSQAVKVDNTVYISGQIPLDPKTMQLVSDGFPAEVKQVFENLSAIAKAAGGTLDKIVKLNVYLIDMNNFSQVNEIMAEYFTQPYPARAAIGVAALPKGVQVEMDAVLVL
jgi:reactive intermediate/imine deaminase